MPSVYSGLSEDDMFISKLLAAQNSMVNIQSELTRLIKDYINIKSKDKKRKEKKTNGSLSSASSNISNNNKRKKQNSRSTTPNLPRPPAAKKAKISQNTPKSTPIVQGMLKTRKNNLTMEEGNKLRQSIATLTAPQQMTVLEILRENGEKLEQDDDGNVEMEFREFSQKSINDLKAYVESVSKPKPELSKILPENEADEDSDSSNDSSSSSSDSDSD